MRLLMKLCVLIGLSLLGSQSIGLANQPAPVARPVVPQKASVDLSYVDSTFAAGTIVRPSQAVKSEFGKALIQNAFQAAEYEQLSRDFSEQFGVELEDVDQLSVLLSEKVMAAMSGVKLPEAGEEAVAVSATQVKNQLRQIVLGFHNYHAVYRKFPAANGKLSWRVHVLPFLEQQELYEQFAMDEDWDSETNKPLIEKMPEIFKSPGVAAAGKSSMHVFAGKGAPFERELKIAQCIDGTSLTVMTVVAGADTAVEWTKPGGLDIDKEDPWKPVGDVRGKSMIVGMMDGFVSEVPTDAPDELLLAALTHNGRELFSSDKLFGQQTGPDPAGLPTIIAHCTKPIDQAKVAAQLGQGMDKPQRKTGNGKEYWDMGGYAVWFPTSKTMVATQTKLLPRLMSNRQTDSKLRQFATKNGSSDLLLMGDAEAMPTMFGMLAENAPLPNLATVTDAWIAVDVTSATLPLLSVNLAMSNENSTKGMQALLGASLAMGQQSMGQMAPPGMESFMETLQGLMRGRQIERDGKALSYTVPKPSDYSATINGMKPEFKKFGAAVRDARAAARRMVRKNALKQVGLAFHNHHDIYNTFGAADGSTGSRKAGLSWRVHLLPLIEEGELYNKFKLDEPWDSDHNKKLIAEMPELFKAEGVEGVGKTAIHVFVGNGALFGDGKTRIRFRDITDGTSNTILAVEAGADTAVTWTKPGGLEFDPNTPFTALGEIGETFNVLFADGSVRAMLKEGDAEELAAYVTKAGGEIVP